MTLMWYHCDVNTMQEMKENNLEAYQETKEPMKNKHVLENQYNIVSTIW